MSERQEAIVLGALTSGPRTLRELQDALASDAAFGTENAVISLVQSMARRGAITRTPKARQEGRRTVAVFAVPEPSKGARLRAEVYSFVGSLVTDYDHEAGLCDSGRCRKCRAKDLLARLMEEYS